MKRKLFTILLGVIMAFSAVAFAACGSDVEECPDPSAHTKEECPNPSAHDPVVLDPMTHSANYGHNGIAFADVRVDKTGKISYLHIDEIEWVFFVSTNWKTGHAVVAGDIQGTYAKRIQVGGVKFTLNAESTFYVSDENVTFDKALDMGETMEGYTVKGAFKAGGTTKAQLPVAQNGASSINWTNEVALHVTNSVRTGKYDVLKADGTNYNVEILRMCPYGSHQASPGTPHVCNATTNQYKCGNLGSGEYKGVTLTDKRQFFVKRFCYVGRNSSGDDRERPGFLLGAKDGAGAVVAVTNLSYDDNMAAMHNWIMETNNGKLPNNWYFGSGANQPKTTIAPDLNVTSGVIRGGTGNPYAGNMFYLNGVSTNATFNDWNWYMYATYVAYNANANKA